jgi:ABC-2 type transport system permease protein
MRTFAEERRRGTIETLLTSTVYSGGEVLGKYVAALLTYAALWLPTTIYFGLLSRIGEIDWRVVGTGYLGVLSSGATYLAVGVFASALARSQLVAAMLAFAAVIGLFMLGLGEFVFPPGVARDLSGYVSVWSAMNELSRGVVDSRRLVFAVTTTAVALFATQRTVESWRWG